MFETEPLETLGGLEDAELPDEDDVFEDTAVAPFSEELIKVTEIFEDVVLFPEITTEEELEAMEDVPLALEFIVFVSAVAYADARISAIDAAVKSRIFEFFITLLMLIWSGFLIKISRLRKPFACKRIGFRHA